MIEPLKTLGRRLCQVAFGVPHVPRRLPDRYVKAVDYNQSNDSEVRETDSHTAEVDEALARLPTDPDDAISTLLRRGQSGSAWAAVQLGYSYYYGNGVAPDPEKAEHWFRRACEAGSDRALLAYAGILMERGDLEAAEKICRPRAEELWPPALYLLALCRWRQSEHRSRDRETRALFEKAAAAGSLAAELFLVRSMTRGRFGLREILPGHKRMKRFAGGIAEAAFNWEKSRAASS